MSLLRSHIEEGGELRRGLGLLSSSLLESTSTSFGAFLGEVEVSFFFEVEAPFYLFLGRDSSLDMCITRET